jgi:hypothetical protein
MLNFKTDRITIEVFDRRNFRKLKKSKCSVKKIEVFSRGIRFAADWRFPVPAHRRFYFIGSEELSIEESGKSLRGNLFLFTGLFIDKQLARSSRK